MWIVFGIRFNKIFSPDGMIEKAREKMNRLLGTMQKSTVDNVNLVRETISKLEQTRIAAERKVDEINRRIELLNSEAGLIRAGENGQKSQIRNTEKPLVDPNAVYSVKVPVQKELFEDEKTAVVKNLSRDETFVTQSGASYKEVPMYDAKLVDESPVNSTIPKITPKKTVDEQVMVLLNNGYKISDIASQLGLSETEVQFVIDLN